jgi:hypothetical protein
MGSQRRIAAQPLLLTVCWGLHMPTREGLVFCLWGGFRLKVVRLDEKRHCAALHHGTCT